jgi:hypothetical protein
MGTARKSQGLIAGRGPACTVCRHPQRGAVELCLLRGVPARTIARRFALSRDAVGRHRRNHLAAALDQALKNRRPDVDTDGLRELERTDLLGHLVGLRTRLFIQLDAAEKLGTWRDVATLHERILALLKAEADLLGELGSRTVQHVHLALTPEWLAVRAAIVQALAPFPEARRAVAAALQQAEAPRTIEAKALPA